MSERMERDLIERELDERLRRMASGVRAAAPEPSGDLIVRILADAANGAGRTSRDAPRSVRTPARARPWREVGLPFRRAWPQGAIAGMATVLIAGIAIGYGFEGDVGSIFGDPDGDFVMAVFADDNLDNIEEYIQ